MCVPVPRFSWLLLCAIVRNEVTNGNRQVCIRFEARAGSTVVYAMNMPCYQVGQSGGLPPSFGGLGLGGTGSNGLPALPTIPGLPTLPMRPNSKSFKQ